MVTGDFLATAGRVLLLRRGRDGAPAVRAHPPGAAAHLPVVAAVPRAVRRGQPVSRRARRGARALQPRCARPPPTRRRAATRDLLDARAADPPRRASRWRRSPTASSASSRSAWRWPERRASSCSTSPPPGCRPRSGASWSALLAALPAAHGLRPDRARPRHRAARRRARDRDAQRPRAQGGHARPRSRTTPRSRRSTWGAPADVVATPRADSARARADPRRRGARRLLRPRARRAGRVAHARARRDRGGRPQRHGQDDAVQRDHGTGAGVRQRAARRRGDPRAAAQRDHRARRRLRAAGAPRLAVALRRRAPAARLARQPRPLDASSASTGRSRGWPSGSATAAPSCRAASSRCWRSRARCC